MGDRDHCRSHEYVTADDTATSFHAKCKRCLSGLTISNHSKCTSDFYSSDGNFTENLCLKCNTVVSIKHNNSNLTFAFITFISQKLPSIRSRSLFILKTYLTGLLRDDPKPINILNPKFVQIGGIEEWGLLLLTNGFKIVDEKLHPANNISIEYIKQTILELSVLEYHSNQLRKLK